MSDTSASRAATHVIFDLDGTLLDSEALYTEATEIVCARYGKHFTLELKRQIMGGASLQGAITVVDGLGLPISPEQYLRERELELTRLAPSIVAMPGAEMLVSKLRAAGVPFAVATSGHRHITEIKLAGHAFLRDIRPIVYGDDARLVRGKPAPDIFLLAARELGAEPTRCCVLEDTVNGVQAGVAAGMRTIAVIDPRFGFRAEHFPGAARTVTSLTDVDWSVLGLA
jgi:pseudouridine-5'-monophosphatase